MATNDLNNDKKHRGLRGMFGKREKSVERPPPGLSSDSAYASSTDAPSGERTTPSLTPETVPVERNSEIGNIDRDKNLALRPATGEVVDQDTGEVVTVVTTTTTTTTTTTARGGGQKPEQDVTRDVQREVHNVPAASTNTTTPTGVTEMPANSVDNRHSGTGIGGTGISHTGPGRRSGDVVRDSPIDSTSTTSSDARLDAPFDPSRGAPPPGQSKHNFSYPSRAAPAGTQNVPSAGVTTSDRPMQHNQGTMSDLKAAAKGIHGIGETLRGTFNDTVDRNFPSKHANKAMAANEKNAETLNHGRAEMEQIPTRSSHGTTGAVDPAYDPATTERSSGLKNILSRKPVGTGQGAPIGQDVPPTTTGPATMGVNNGQAPMAEQPKKHRFF